MQLTLVRQPFAERPVKRRHLSDAPPVSVQQIDEADLEAVGRLYAACHAPSRVAGETAAIEDMHASWRGRYGKWLRDASLVAELNGRPIAAVLVVDSPPWHDVIGLVFVTELFTEPGYRRRGLGEALMTESLHTIDANRVVGLRVDSDNFAAVALYRKLGFDDREVDGESAVVSAG